MSDTKKNANNNSGIKKTFSLEGKSSKGYTPQPPILPARKKCEEEDKR